MQIWGNAPWHCRAVSHRSAACAGAPTSALSATMAANNIELDVTDLIMISSSGKINNRASLSRPKNKIESQAANARPVIQQSLL